MIRIISFCLLSFLVKTFAQSGAESIDMKSFYYLEGKWMIEGKERNIYEEWRIENDTLMSSYSYYVEKGDTSYSETVELKKTGGDIFYIPSVEYNAGPVKFKLISLIKNKAVFENPQHDFPTKIIYEKINNDRLHASIEGMIEGKLKVIEYNFKRIR